MTSRTDAAATRTASAQWTNVVDRALHRIREESGMDVAFCARVTPGGRQLVIERTLGTCTEALHGLVVRGGTGLGGKAMVLRQPVAVDDYVRARSISHHYDQAVAAEGLHAIMAVPLVVTGRALGVLYAAWRRRLGIGDRPKFAVMTVARDAELLLAQPSSSAQQRRPVRADGPSALHADLSSIIDRVDDHRIRSELMDIRTRLAEGHRVAAAQSGLSEREYEALCHAALGLGNAEIAERMGLVPGTVKAYLRSVMRKLDCHNRLAAVNAARALGYDL